MQDLIYAGAKHILVMNLPDLCLAPGVIYNSDADADAFTSWSMTFNALLSQLVCDFRGAYPKVKYYMADTFELLQYAMESGESLGFTNVDGTCSWDGALPFCEGYIFFDGIHPTTATHQYLAALAVAQVKHGRVSKELKELLQKFNPIQPRMPFVVQCKD
ncbi:MAG: SGNH/GDSL hydrolase family protein [Desulfobacterales bacterium]